MIEQARALVMAADQLSKAKARLASFQKNTDPFVRWTNPTGSPSGYDGMPMTPEIKGLVEAALTADIASAELAVTAKTQAMQGAAKGDSE